MSLERFIFCVDVSEIMKVSGEVSLTKDIDFHDNLMKRTNVSKCGRYVAQINVLKFVCSQDVWGSG